MNTFKTITLFMLACTLLIAACSSDSTPEPPHSPPQTDLPFATSAIQERMTLPPSWTPTATPSVTPTPTNTFTPTITLTPSMTPTRTVTEICELFSGQVMTFGRTRFDIRSRLDYFFAYDDPTAQIVLRAVKENTDEVVQVRLPPGFVLGTFDVSELSAGQWEITFSLDMPEAGGLCESEPIILEITESSPLDQLIDALSTFSAAQKATTTPTPEAEPSPEATTEIQPEGTP